VRICSRDRHAGADDRRAQGPGRRTGAASGRNSGNSSMPPSSDVFTKPAKPAAPKSGRRRGRQPGAPGGGLALVADPHEVVDIFPSACGGCAAALTVSSEADSAGYARRQCWDIPAVSVAVTETRWHTVRCGCGHATAAAVPGDIADAPCYGPGLASLAVYLVVHQHIPIERASTADRGCDRRERVDRLGRIAAAQGRRPGRRVGQPHQSPAHPRACPARGRDDHEHRGKRHYLHVAAPKPHPPGPGTALTPGRGQSRGAARLPRHDGPRRLRPLRRIPDAAHSCASPM